MKARLLSMLLAGVMMFSTLGTTVSAQEIQSVPEEVTAEELQEVELQEVELQEVELEVVAEDEVVGETVLAGGSSKEAAVAISFDEEYVANFPTKDATYYWYKFTTKSEPGYYYLKVKNLSASSYIAAHVYTSLDENLKYDNYIYVNDTMGYTAKLEAGNTYYIRVYNQKSAGNAKLSVTYTADPEGNDISNAYVLTENHLYRGQNAADGDIDYFKFTTGAAGHYGLTVVNESVGSSVYYRLKSQYGEDLSNGYYVYKSDSKYMDMDLSANTTYYIYTKGNGAVGNYTLTYTYLVDNEGDTINDAANLSEGAEYSTTLCNFNDVDYYKIVPDFSGRYDIKLVNRNNSSSISLYLYSEHGEQLKYDNYVYSGDKEAVFQYSLEQGKIYYLRVKGGNSGDYMICFKKDFPFTDVAPLQEGHWQYEAVEYVYENSIMSGKKATLFDPKANLTRAEFAQVLYNMAGKPYVSYKSAFTDVPSGQWYTNAVIWAYKQGIVSGYSDGRFGIKDNITREQVAKVLYMYSEYKRENVSYRASLSGFPDNGNVSGWAKSYVEWAVAMKMISGKTVDGNLCLVPKGQATRAECAAMISRYLQK